MYCGRDYDVAQQTENDVYGFDFVNDLAPGDAIVGATFTLSVLEGTDPSPSGHLINTPWLQSNTIANQRINGLLTGVKYALTCTVPTAQGNTLTLYSRINSVATV